MENRVIDNVKWLSRAEKVKEMPASSLTQKKFEDEYVRMLRPLLIRGAISHWPCMEKWQDMDYLEEIVGGQLEFFYPHSNYMDENVMRVGEEILSFADGIARMKKADASQIMSMMPSINDPCHPDIGNFNELLQDMGKFNFLTEFKSPFQFAEKRTFFYRGAETSWHRHLCDETLLSQVAGRKKVGLFFHDRTISPKLKKALNKEEYLSRPENFSKIDANLVRPLIAEIGEGDALYIPPFWWHGASPSSNEKIGISIAHCWQTPVEVLGDLSLLGVRDFWATTLLSLDKLSFRLPSFWLSSYQEKKHRSN